MKESWKGIIQKKDDGSEKVNYNDETFPAYIHDGYIRKTSSWGNVPHYHEDIEFTTVYKGQMGYNINGENITLNEGDTIMINSNQIHYSYTSTEEKCHYVIYILHPNILCSTFVVEEKYVKTITENNSLPYYVFRSCDEISRQVFDNAFRILDDKNNPFATTRHFFNLWNLILENCIDNYKEAVEHRSSPSLQTMKEMLSFCQNNYAKDIRLNDIAEYAGVSCTYCNKLFHKYINRTPMENLMRIRCEHATKLLLDSELSMSEIAEKTGFSSASYFAETFKKIYNKSPKSYQRFMIEERN